MEESDVILISNLKQYISLPDSIKSVKDIQTNEIHLITCNVFETLNIDTKQLKEISNAQKFRAMTKLTQSLNQELDSKIELNDVMNPTVAIVRKLILGLLNKLGSTEIQKSKIHKNNLSEDNSSANHQRKIFKNWLNQEYIHPLLREEKTIKYAPHRLKVTLNKDLLKRNLYSELNNVAGNAHIILRESYVREQIQRKKKEANEGINRKESEYNEMMVQDIVKGNRQDWQQTNNKRMKKIKKKLLEKDNEEQNASKQEKKQEKQVPLSIYQQEVQVLAEEKKKINKIEQKQHTIESTTVNEESEDPLQKLRNQYDRKKKEMEERLRQLMNRLGEKKQKIEEHTELKQKLQEQIILYEERGQQQKEDRVILKKQVQKLKIMQDSIEGETDINKQVKQLQEEVKYIEKEANKQIKELEQEIERMKNESKQKIQILTDLKIKLNKIQNQYHQICEQIQEKEEIKGKVKINKSGTSRMYYSKKISEMEVRWRETQKEIKKISDNVNTLREQSRKAILGSQRAQTQFENLVNSSKWRTQSQNIQFKEVFNRCKNSFQQTLNTLDQLNEIKTQIQQYEMKVHSLSGKNYKKSIEKANQALKDLKQEINALKSKK